MIDSKHKKNSIPAFRSQEEEAAWFDSHDISEYWDELTPVEVDFQLEKPKE